MNVIEPVERKTSTAFAVENLSKVVPKMRMTPIVLTTPAPAEITHKSVRRKFIGAPSHPSALSLTEADFIASRSRASSKARLVRRREGLYHRSYYRDTLAAQERSYAKAA